MIEYYDKEELELQISNYLSVPGLSGKCLPYGHFLPYRRLQK